MTATLRVLIDPPLDGPTNMGRDEALLDAVGAGDSPATLRFYQWSQPTISLGYFQPYAALETSPAAGRFPVVRRTTGGGAILHDRELTYCLAVGTLHPLLRQGPTNLYRLMHDAIIEAVCALGIQARCRGCADKTGGSGCDDGREEHGRTDQAEPFFCFARAHPLDIAVDTLKLAGSAQRRTPNAVLQHGSLILARTFEQQPSAAVWDHTSVDAGQLADGIARRFADANGLVLAPDGWTAPELARAKTHATRYNSRPWTRRR